MTATLSTLNESQISSVAALVSGLERLGYQAAQAINSQTAELIVRARVEVHTLREFGDHVLVSPMLVDGPGNVWRRSSFIAVAHEGTCLVVPTTSLAQLGAESGGFARISLPFHEFTQCAVPFGKIARIPEAVAFELSEGAGTCEGSRICNCVASWFETRGFCPLHVWREPPGEALTGLMHIRFWPSDRMSKPHANEAAYVPVWMVENEPNHNAWDASHYVLECDSGFVLVPPHRLLRMRGEPVMDEDEDQDLNLLETPIGYWVKTNLLRGLDGAQWIERVPVELMDGTR